MFSVAQFPISFLYNCTKTDFFSAWGFECSVAGYATPPLGYVSLLTCVNASTSSSIGISNVTFPSQGRVAVYLNNDLSTTMLDSVTCFSTVLTQVSIEDTTNSSLLDQSRVWISSVYLTSSNAAAYPDSLVATLTDSSAIVSAIALSQALSRASAEIELLCDGVRASVTRGSLTSAGTFTLDIQNCSSNTSVLRPPAVASFSWPDAVLYASGKKVSSFSDSGVESVMQERVLSVRCVNSGIFILFDRQVSVSSASSFSVICSHGGLSLRGSLGRTVVVDAAISGPCPFLFYLDSGTRVFLNGSWCDQDECSMGRVVSAVSVSNSYISVEFEGTACNETLRSPGLFFLQADNGDRVPITTAIFNGSRVAIAYERYANSTDAILAHELLGPLSPTTVSASTYPYADVFVCRRNIFDQTAYFVSVQIAGQWNLDAGYSITPATCTVRSATRMANVSLVEIVLPSGDENDLSSCAIMINYTSVYTLTKNFTAIALSRCELPELVSGPSNLFTDYALWISFIVMFAYVFPLFYVAIVQLAVYLEATVSKGEETF